MTRVASGDVPNPRGLWPRLSRSANSGLLWIAIAAGLGATGDKWARRAALRGLVSVAIASSTANVIVKGLARRNRPALDIPVVRLRIPAPRSSSFPSGHSASAAAFATGVALEMPSLALPIGALAAAVGTSRVVNGVHYPSDVLAGFAIGTAAGVLTLRWWPLRPARPAEAVRPRTGAPASLTGEGLVLAVNESAGRASPALAARLRAELPAATVIEVSAGQNVAGLLRGWALEAANESVTILGVAGGDGTISAAAGVALDLDLPLLVVPSGTFNHFAADLGIRSPDAALAALRAGDAVLVDIGLAGGRSFVNTASMGVYVDLVHARRRLEDRVGKWAAVAIALVQVLRIAQPDDVVIDGRRGRLWLLFAGNCRYEPQGFAPSYRPKLSDGQLDLRVIFATAPFGRSRLVASVLTGTLGRSRVYRAWTAGTVEITTPDGKPIRFARDGELSEGATTLTLAKRQQQLLVYRKADA